jgi:hypothetical protein
MTIIIFSIKSTITAAEEHQKGNAFNQLNGPCGMYVETDQTIYTAGSYNHLIVERKCCASSGEVATLQMKNEII